MENSRKIIEAIKDQNIRPIPRWRFNLRNGIIRGGFILSVVLGAISFSIILFAIQQTDFNILSHLSHSKMEMFLGLLPFIWIIFLLIFLVLAIFSIKYSWKGYKFTVSKLVGISTAISILIGTLFFISGGAQRLEHIFATSVTSYESIQDRKEKMWSNPKEGYLAGTIQSTNDQVIQLNDFQNQTWEISYGDAFIAPILFLEKGEKIKLVGTQTGKGTFKAKEIRPWGGMMNQRGKGGKN